MSAIAGKVGKWDLSFQKAPRGKSGTVEVEVTGKGLIAVQWLVDEDGIWISHSNQVIGFDVEGQRDDDGVAQYRLAQRSGGAEWSGLSFRRAGEAEASDAQAGKKKSSRVRSQMPGKIVRVEIKVGDLVQKGDSILVMEAMKMENDIRAPHTGVVSAVKVVVGQAVETGADLVLMDPQ